MLRFHYFLAVLAASISTVTAAITNTAELHYALPNGLARTLAQSDCYLPLNFTVSSLEIWIPAPNNPNNFTAYFEYMDRGTNITTECQRNASSPNVGGEGHQPRWACDFPIVEFLWSDNTLTIVEKTCASNFEASGSVQPSLSCVNTTAPFPSGDGAYCQALGGPLNGNFTSLQPPPPVKFVQAEVV